MHPIKTIKEKRNGSKKKNPGIIRTMLNSISSGILKELRGSFIYFLFSSLYDSLNEKCRTGFLHSTVRRSKKGSGKQSARTFLTRQYEESLLCKVLSYISERLINSFVRLWGMGFFTFAFVMIFVAMVKYYFVDEIMMDNVVLGGIIVFLSIPLIISKKRLGETLVGGIASKYVAVEILKLDETKYQKNELISGGSYGIVFAISSILGLITYLVSPWSIITAVLLCLVFVVLMSFPELGIILSLGFIPLSSLFERPSFAILLIIAFTAFGYFFKLLRGRRIINFELIDVFVLMFGITILLGGVFTSGGIESLFAGITYFVFILIYFLVVNSYIRKTWIYRGVKLIVVTTSLVAIISIFNEKFTDAFSSILPDLSRFGITVASFLGNPNMLAVYMIIVFPLILGQFVVTNRKMGKPAYLICILAVVGCIVLTWSRGAWLGLLVATISFLIAYNFNNIWLVGATLVGVAIWNSYLPQSVTERFFSIFNPDDPSVIYHFNLWRGVFNMSADNYFAGVGVGNSAFAGSYEGFALAGTEGAPHAYSLFMQILAETGIIGLVLFIAVMVMFVQKCFKGMKTMPMKSKSRIMVAAGLSGIFGALTMGITDHIWFSYRVFLIFWAVVSLTVALVRINEKKIAKEEASVIEDNKNADIDVYF